MTAWLEREGVPFTWVPYPLEPRALIYYAALQEKGDGPRPVFRPFTVHEGAARVNRSAGTVRRALRRLAAEGLAERQPDGRWRLIPPWEYDEATP